MHTFIPLRVSTNFNIGLIISLNNKNYTEIRVVKQAA
jgi:hypothetical protein